MKSKLLSTALFSLLIGFSACKKEDKPLDPGTVVNQNNQLSAKIDGATFKTKEVTAVADMDTHTFLLTASDDQENSVSITGPAEVGNFSSTTNEEAGGFYINKDGGVWLSTIGDGSATITITKFDASSKKMSGTFTFTAPASGAPATGNKTITNGSFTDVSVFIQ